ncbi:phosphoglucosamine mutase [Thiohalorhabdus methylotrophus]|uniref:Phosphoglucosamine mutase n=1 Tax=Thiohalorhabdus methylotrophus TaxID=3242694 RepID=A0ABV4TZZ5_9GAMM
MSGKRTFFGTDGVRGQVGEWPITPDQVLKLGWAAGRVLAGDNGDHPRVVIGKDTRVSGYLLESALEAGLAAAGVDVLLIGPMPTPGIAYLTRALRADAGVVISASHNPFADNGIKLFGPDGCKLADDVEAAIESRMADPLLTAEPAKLGKATRVEDAAGRYIEFCKHTFPKDLTLEGMRLVVDCAHGATYRVAPQVFRELGAEVIEVGARPDGFNINEDVGSMHPDTMAAEVVAREADAGMAFDGDGDRVVFADSRGRIVDGDGVLYLAALEMKKRGELDGGVVGTIMSNLGLEQGLAGAEIPFERAPVGDRHVFQMLREHGWILGGEPSGHVMCLTRNTTGDGIVTALMVLAELAHSGQPLDQAVADLRYFPQAQVSIRLPEQRDIGEFPAVAEVIRQVEAELGEEGRVVVRNSGTEPKVRVMVEGRDEPGTHALAERIAEVVRAEVATAQA